MGRVLESWTKNKLFPVPPIALKKLLLFCLLVFLGVSGSSVTSATRSIRIDRTTQDPTETRTAGGRGGGGGGRGWRPHTHNVCILRVCALYAYACIYIYIYGTPPQ